MPATLPPPHAPLMIIQRTTTAYSEEAKRLYDWMKAIIKTTEVTASWQGRDDVFGVLGETGIYAEADFVEPRTLNDLAEARHQFLASIQFTPLDAELPPVLLSEG